MNLPRFFAHCVAAALVFCAEFLLMRPAHAQPASQNLDNRFLFIFDTSSDMKKRLPAVQAEVNQLLATSMGGQLRVGDTIGVWTFDQDLRAGQFPLQRWRPEDAVTIASGINKFVSRQRYANRTRFSALQPDLNRVIRNSGRLTVLIFCDGEDEISGTPYDVSINQIFQQRQAGQKKASQPFVLVLRTQLGQYTGSTMNFPPGMVNLPEFPPPPAPPAPTNPPPHIPAPAPVVKPPPTGAPLIIVGTNVLTSLPSAPKSSPPTNTVPKTAAKPVAPANTNAPLLTNSKPAVQTNAASVPSAILPAPTNAVASGKPAAPPMPANSASAGEPRPALTPSANSAPVTPAKVVPEPSSEKSNPAHKGMIILGVALLMVAVVLGALAIFRRRPDRGSLISRSMRKD